MGIESSTTTFRERTRFTATARRPAGARQVTVPGTDVQLSDTQAAIAGGALLLGALLLARRGAPRRGFEIRDIGA